MSKGSYRDRMWASAMNSESEENNRLRKKVKLLEDKIADMAKFINEQSLELAEARRSCQDMETKLHNECQTHSATKDELEKERTAVRVLTVEIKRLRKAIGDVQNTLEQIPCGGVEVITREEIDAANAVGHCVENDAVLHISATAYLICEEALKGGDK